MGSITLIPSAFTALLNCPTLFFTDDMLDACLEVLEDVCDFLWKNFVIFQVCQGNPIDSFLVMLVVKLLAVRLH